MAFTNGSNGPLSNFSSFGVLNSNANSPGLSGTGPDFNFVITAGVNQLPTNSQLNMNGGARSLTDSKLEFALQKVLELTQENTDLKEVLKDQTELMKKNCEAMVVWKQRQKEMNELNRLKFEECKENMNKLKEQNKCLKEGSSAIPVTSTGLDEKLRGLQDENTNLKSNLVALQDKMKEVSEKKPEEILVSSSIETDQKISALEDVIENNKEELQTKKDEIAQLEKELKQFQDHTEQLMGDLQNNQRLKAEVESEYRNLTTDNNKLRQDLQDLLQEYKSVKHNYELEIETRQQYENELKKMGKVSTLSASHSEPDMINALGQFENESDVIQSFSGLMDINKLNSVERQAHKVQIGSQTDIVELSGDRNSEIEIHRRDETIQELRHKVNVYEQVIQKLQQDIELKSKTSDFQKRELAELTQKYQQKESELVQATINKKLVEEQRQQKEESSLTSPASIRYSADVVDGLKNQVLCLMNENHDLDSKLQAAIETVNKRTERCRELETLNNSLQHTTQRRSEDDSLMQSLKAGLQHCQAVLSAERNAHQETKQQMNDLRASFNQLVADYKELLEKFDQEQKGKGSLGKEDQEKVNHLTAQIIAADEGLAARDAQIKKLKEELESLPVLRIQAEDWRADFEAERNAREKQHAEKEQIQQEMANLRIQNQQLIDELESFQRGEISDMQRRHANMSMFSPPGTYTQQPRTGQHSFRMATPPSRTSYPPSNQQSMNQGQYLRYPYPSPHPPLPEDNPVRMPQSADMFRPPSQPSEHGEDIEESNDSLLYCPKCNRTCPDMDSLYIHVNDCLNNP